MPDSGLRSNNMQWDFWTLSPESAHQVTILIERPRDAPDLAAHARVHGDVERVPRNQAGVLLSGGRVDVAPASLAVMVQSPLGTAAVHRWRGRRRAFRLARRGQVRLADNVNGVSQAAASRAELRGNGGSTSPPDRFATRPRAAAAQATEAAPAFRQSVLWPGQRPGFSELGFSELGFSELGFSELGIPDRTT